MGKDRYFFKTRKGFGVCDTFLGTEHSLVTVFSSDTRGLWHKMITRGSLLGKWQMYVHKN
jgi:hypothetical protein